MRFVPPVKCVLTLNRWFDHGTGKHEYLLTGGTKLPYNTCSQALGCLILYFNNRSVLPEAPADGIRQHHRPAGISERGR